MGSSIEDNKKIALSYFSLGEKGDADGITELFVPDGIVRSMGTTFLASKLQGHDEIRMAHSGIYDAFPDGLKLAPLTVIGEGDTVAVELVSLGTTVAGKIYNNQYVFLFFFRNGKIVEMREYLDSQHVNDVLFDGKHP